MDSARNNLNAFKIPQCKIIESDGEEIEVSIESFDEEMEKLDELMKRIKENEPDLNLDSEDELLSDLEDDDDEVLEENLSRAMQPKNERLTCLVHTLQNCINKSIEVNEELSNFMEYLELCFSFFNNRIVSLNEMRRKHNKSLLKPVITRWSSRHKACVRLNDVSLGI